MPDRDWLLRINPLSIEFFGYSIRLENQREMYFNFNEIRWKFNFRIDRWDRGMKIRNGWEPLPEERAIGPRGTFVRTGIADIRDRLYNRIRSSDNVCARVSHYFPRSGPTIRLPIVKFKCRITRGRSPPSISAMYSTDTKGFLFETFDRTYFRDCLLPEDIFSFSIRKMWKIQ